MLLAAIPFVLLFLAGVASLLRLLAGGPGTDLTGLFEAYLPPHPRGSGDPFAAAEAMLGRVARYGQQLSLVAVPAFLWFATRAFASVRTALNEIYDVSLRPLRRGYVVGFLLGKLRDVVMVLATLGLFLVSTLFSTGLALAQARGQTIIPWADFFLSLVGRGLAEVITVGSALALFLLLYRFASQRRLRFHGALVASVFATLAYEVARRLFAFYITSVASWARPSIDATLGALVLFLLWLYFSSLVLLLGAVVGETWELGHLLRRHQTRPA